jgi:aspartate kinase
MGTIILKFGGASVKTHKSFSKIAKIIIDKSKDYKNIVVVISAMYQMTNDLIDLAKKVNSNPSTRELDMLISVGERISISLLSMALDKYRKESISLTGSQSGIITTNDHMDAKILDVKPYRIEEALKKNKIVIVAGFQGVSEQKDITTLGRGGSDTSAVALAISLKAELIEFYKDVDGIYDIDPRKNKNSIFFEKLSFDEALEIIKNNKHAILHPRCLNLAKKNNQKLIVRSFKNYQKSKNKKKFTIIEKDSFQKVEKNIYEIY